MTTETRPIVLFDLDFVLAKMSRVDVDGNAVIDEIYPDILTLLSDLKSTAEIAIVHPGMEKRDVVALVEQSQLGQLTQRIHGGNESDDKILEEVTSAILGSNPSRVGVYVSASRYRRWTASRLGWRPCPHPRLAEKTIENADIAYFVASARVSVASDRQARARWKDLVIQHSIVPVLIDMDDLRLYGLGHRGSIKKLSSAGIAAQELCPSIGSGDLIEVISSDLSPEEIEQFDRELAEVQVISREGRRTVVLASGDPDVPLPHPPRVPHGHNRVLIPAVAHVAPLSIPPFNTTPLTDREIGIIKAVTTKDYDDLHGPLCGSRALPGIGYINDRRMAASEKIVKHLAATLRALLGERSVTTPGYFNGARQRFHNIDARISGKDPGAGIVILAAHLDSFAQASSHCDFESGLAPGADDDASGVAAVLLAARVLRGLVTKDHPRREIRFVLFNGEESGRAGSSQYALDIRNEPIVAVINVDMIGWHLTDHPRRFYARGPGTYRSRTFSDACEAVAKVISDAGGVFGLECCRTDTSQKDPLATRGDHTLFYERDIPACLVVEPGIEFTASNPGGKERNPYYHTSCDSLENFRSEPAASISKAVISAVWQIAK
jgi:hypothetical protein